MARCVATLRPVVVDGRDGIEQRARISEFLEATFEAMDEGIAIFDDGLRLVSWNQRYLDIMGAAVEPFTKYGAQLLDFYVDSAKRGLFGPGDPIELAKARIDAARSGPLLQTEDLTPSPGRVVRINRFRLDNGGICATFRDETEERRIEAQLRQAQKMEAVGKLTGGVAHDLNNILAVVIGNVEILLDAAGGDLEREALDDVLTAANRGAELTHRLLAFARKQPLTPQPTRVAPLLETLCSMLRRLLGETIDVVVVAAPDLWLCDVDRGQFENTIINLAVNARDALASGGTVRIEASNLELTDRHVAEVEGPGVGEYVAVTVTDNGAGMTDDVQARAFDPFFTTKPSGQGTGLGLSMVHGFVKQSGGHVRIDSEVGEGTSVRILLPRSEGAEERTPERPDVDMRSEALVTETVLVVEDDARVRAIVTRQLKVLGYSTLEAATAEEALRALDGGARFDLLLTDVVLPGLTGHELASRVSTSRPELPVVFMSGYTEDMIPQAQLDAGVTLLPKPFQLAELARVLRQKLRNA